MTRKVALISAATQYLRSVLHDGTDVYTLIRHVSRGGTKRAIALLVVTSTGISDVSLATAHVLDARFDLRRQGVTVYGCGQDMGAALVRWLGVRLGLELYHRGL